MRLLAWSLMLGALAPQLAAATTGIPGHIERLFRSHCQTCHNARDLSGGLDVAALAHAGLDQGTRPLWGSVLEKLSAGVMPPSTAPQPTKQHSRAAVHWLRAALDRFDRSVKPDPGRVTARRLNRVEYNNSVRDLFGFDLCPADQFPHDDSGYGFDNVADALTLPPVLMEQYLLAAERVVRRALFGQSAPAPTVVRLQPPPRWGLDGGNAARFLDELPYTILDYDESGLSHPSALHAEHFFPVSGLYDFRISPEGNRPRPSDPFEGVVWIDGRRVASVQLVASDSPTGMEGEDRHVRLWVEAGHHELALAAPRVYEGLPPRYGGRNPTSLPQPLPGDDNWHKRLEQPARISDVRFRFNYLEITGPFEPDLSPNREVLERIMACGHVDQPLDEGCLRTSLAAFARRAFRRPPAEDELGRLVNFASSVGGDDFRESLAAGLQAILVSPSFLFRIERDPAPGAERSLDGFELAARLAYFLWSTTPDDALLNAAQRGELDTVEGRRAVVLRMLQDPRVAELARNFGGQWLQFRALESVKPDRDRFARFDTYLRRSMQRETELFFEDIIRSDRSVLDFIDARHTFLNENLARYYGIGAVRGPRFRRVDLTGTPRGGVLTHASVLTVTSYPTRTSPVLRGKWVLDNLLGEPPPPPPPDIPAIEEGVSGTLVSLREQLERHRSDTACASCHARMDPLGFALEHFDAIGRWREKEGELEIDASAALPTGQAFEGAHGLRTVLARQGDAFAKALAEKMMTYALGRGLGPADGPAITAVTDRMRKNEHRFSSLVLGIVESLPFQRRRAAKEGT